MEYSADWLTEKQLIAETKIGSFTLDRRRREGLVPWSRRFLGFEVGTLTVYPPIAVPMIRRIQELQREFKGVDRWRWALWLEGYPVDIVQWNGDRLLGLQHRAEALAKGNIKTVVVEASGKGRLRGKPLQPILNQLRQSQARRAVLEWSVTIGIGSVPPASFYTPGSPTAKALSKALEAGQPPDPALEIEKMSIARLHKIITSAGASDVELARRDCNRLAGLIRLASSLDWHRVREVLGVTHQGGPASPIAPFERSSGFGKTSMSALS